MLKNIQKEVEDLRVKVYSGQSNEDTEKALYEIEQLLFKAMDKQLILSGVSQQRELLLAFAGWLYGNLDKEVKEFFKQQKETK